MKSQPLALGIAALSLAPAAQEAPRLDGTAGIGLAVAAQRYDGPFGNGTSPYARALLVYHPTEWLGLRGLAGYGNITNVSDQFRTKYLTNLGAEFVLQPRLEALGAWRPYVGSGIVWEYGAIVIDDRVRSVRRGQPFLPAEIGVEWLLTRNLSANAFLETRLCAVELKRPAGLFTGSSYYAMKDDLPRAGLGLTWRFGSDPATPSAPVHEAPPEVVPVVIPPAVATIAPPSDNDHDGVLDSLDKCPGTPEGVKVDASGCPVDSDHDGVPDHLDKCPGTPEGVKVDAAGCPVDSDRDGIPDTSDKCPGTPEGAKVDAAGCPVDSDKDEVPDGLDKCPGTVAGTKVDSTGCLDLKVEKGAKINLEGIKFALGKADIDSAYLPTLAYAAQTIAKNPAAKVEVAGFTDNMDRTHQNLPLSAKRAQAVREVLVKLGVPEAQITAKGYGAAEPIADNATLEGRAKNRRIELRIK